MSLLNDLKLHQEAEDNLLTAKQIESLVFTVVGIAIAFLLSASLLFGVCQCALATRWPSPGGQYYNLLNVTVSSRIDKHTLEFSQ